MKPLILASTSPRRKQLLKKLGLKFKAVAPDFQEKLDANLKPLVLVKKLAQAKAKNVAQRYNHAIVIGADTIVVFKNRIIGKPRNVTEAKKILRQLSGKIHQVISAFTIIDTQNNKTVTKTVTTKVYFKQLTVKEIDNYVKTKEPLDKAGAYAIQGRGAKLIEKIKGDYYNVVGLPIEALITALKNLKLR